MLTATTAALGRATAARLIASQPAVHILPLSVEN
jgi:hypothetical protein